uniref:G factor-1 n=1 Tax=Parechinus angulosus TaxID=7658 RepID=Q8T3T4_PARAN|nr:G factor-1 [Parechinus angulosus]
MSTLPQPLSHCLLNQVNTAAINLPHQQPGLITDIKPMISNKPPPTQEVKPNILAAAAAGLTYPPLNVPSLPAMPNVSMPNVSLPNVSMPNVSMPNVSMPTSVSMPSVSMPSVSMPSASMPSVTLHNQQGNNSQLSNSNSQRLSQMKKCPNEFLHQNPQSERQLFYNDVAMQLYNSDFNKFASKKEFHGYLLEQQKWRWDTHSYIGNLETRVHNLLINPNSGVAQNVARYRSVPIKCKSEDVKRCEATSKELENMATRIASVRQQLLHKKGTLLTSSDNSVIVWQNELAYIEQLFDRTDQMYNEVLSTLASVNQTFSHLQTSFTAEAAELADRRRLWRRRKENNRKRRKRMEKQLEKIEQRSCELLFHITSRGAYDRVRSHPEMPRIGPSEVNTDMLNGIKSKSEVRPLMHLLSKGYMTPGAMEMVSQKIQKLECGIKTEAHQQATQVGINSLAINKMPVPASRIKSILPPAPPPVTGVASSTMISSTMVSSVNSAAPVTQQSVPTVNLNTQLAK